MSEPWEQHEFGVDLMTERVDDRSRAARTDDGSTVAPFEPPGPDLAPHPPRAKTPRETTASRPSHDRDTARPARSASRQANRIHPTARPDSPARSARPARRARHATTPRPARTRGRRVSGAGSSTEIGRAPW